MAVESRGDLASRHGSIGRFAAAHSWSYRSDNPICTRTLEIQKMVSSGDKTAAKVVRLLKVHLTTSRLLARDPATVSIKPHSRVRLD